MGPSIKGIEYSPVGVQSLKGHHLPGCTLILTRCHPPVLQQLLGQLTNDFCQAKTHFAGWTHLASWQNPFASRHKLAKSICQPASTPHFAGQQKNHFAGWRIHFASWQNIFCRLAKLIAPTGKLNKTLFWRKLAELILPTSSFGQLAKLILPAGKIHLQLVHFAG